MVCQPLVLEKQRDEVVSPPGNNNQGIIAPVDTTSDDIEAEAHEEDSGEAEVDDNWEELVSKYEDLATKVHDYLDDEQGDNADVRNPPIAKPPPLMTRHEWEKHQVTHTHTPRMHQVVDIVLQHEP